MRRNSLLPLFAVLFFAMIAGLAAGVEVWRSPAAFDELRERLVEDEAGTILHQHFFHAAPKTTTEEEKTRAAGTLVEEPVYVPFDDRQDSALMRQAAYSFVFDNLSPAQSRFILYPQSFATKGGVQFPQGALVSTTDAGFGGAFAAIADNANITLSSTKALYDTRHAF